MKSFRFNSLTVLIVFLAVLCFLDQTVEAKKKESVSTGKSDDKEGKKNAAASGGAGVKKDDISYWQWSKNTANDSINYVYNLGVSGIKSIGSLVFEKDEKVEKKKRKKSRSSKKLKKSENSKKSSESSDESGTSSSSSSSGSSRSESEDASASSKSSSKKSSSHSNLPPAIVQTTKISQNSASRAASKHKIEAVSAAGEAQKGVMTWSTWEVFAIVGGFAVVMVLGAFFLMKIFKTANTGL